MSPELHPADARITRVSIGEFRVAGAGERLVIHGLGSCVALLLHDPSARLSALGHFLLPEPPAGAEAPAGRFASTGVPEMVAALRRRGAVPSRLVAKVTGAAQMFQYERRGEAEGIGARNLQVTLEALARLRIPIRGSDTGGSHGRTIAVDAGTGRMEVRAVRVEERIL
jgi:chemotaxis protein CheD